MNWDYYIDVVGSCNLRCPSCPVGNSTDADRPAGIMSNELFEKILQKIKRDAPDVTNVNLYNWTEPFVHPRLAELIELAWKYDLHSTLSSNLNIVKRLDDVMRARPHRLRVSLSGYSQELYGRTHVKGDIERVKDNMRLISEKNAAYGNHTTVEVFYHCYIDNLGADYASMREFAHSLGFNFSPMWAYMMPIEKYLEHFNGGLKNEADRKVVDLLAVKPDEAKQIALRNPHWDCKLRSGQTVINCDGTVSLCCGAYDLKYKVADSFLDIEHDALQKRKYEHPLCTECMGHGIHDILVYSGLHEWTATAKQRIAPVEVPPELQTLTRRPSRLRRLVRKIFHPHKVAR